MNLSILRGNLTRDPELKSAGGTMLCKFTIAVNHGTKDKPYTSFFDCQAWGKQAEIIAKYMRKGSQILMRYEPRQERWQDKDGKTRSRVVFNVEAFEFIGGKREESETGAALADHLGAETVDSPLADKDIPF